MSTVKLYGLLSSARVGGGRRGMRTISWITASAFLWSLAIRDFVYGATYRTPPPPAMSRTLSGNEMSSIVGATPMLPDPGGSGGGDVSNPGATPGFTMPWVGQSIGVNTGTGNKLTSLDIVSWKARGGLPVDLALYHNSIRTLNAELGQKWSCTYDTSISIDGSGNASVRWGDGRAYTFTKNIDGSYTAPTGIFDKLIYVPAGGSVAQYSLTTKDQTQYVFYYPVGSTWPLGDILDENGNDVEVVTDSNLRPTLVYEVGVGRSITLGYDSSNRIHTVTDPLGRQWIISYDGSNQLTEVDYPPISGTTYKVKYAYNTDHDITSITDPRTNIWSFQYNSDDTLQWAKDPALNKTSFGYTSTTTTITDPNGYTFKHAYDSSGRMSSTTDQLNFPETYTYDSSNNVRNVQDRRGNNWTFTYDSTGNIQTAQSPYNLAHGYAAAGITYNTHNKPLTITLPGSESITIGYDASDNPTTIKQYDAVGTLKATTTIDFPAGCHGLPDWKQDANVHKTLYSYDTYGNINQLTTPKGNVWKWQYDALNFCTQRTDAMSRITNYTPDAWERLSAITYPTSTYNRTYGYDPNSNLTSFATPGLSLSYGRSYDAENRMLTEAINSVTVITHTYDAAGQKGLLSSTTDATGRLISYAYTVRDQVHTVTDTSGLYTYGYDPNGNETSLTLANGAYMSLTPDANNRVSQLTNYNSSNTALSQYAYAYNSDGQKMSCTELDGSVTSWTYNGLLQLTDEVRVGSNAYDEHYVPDPIGNRASMHGHSWETGWANQTTSFTLDADDELTSTSGYFNNTYGYDANGEQTSRGAGGHTYTLGFDYDGNLLSMIGVNLQNPSGGNHTVSFTYDALDRQYDRLVDGSGPVRYYDGDQPLVEYTNSSNYTRLLYGNGDELLHRGGEYPLTDGLGNVAQSTDGSDNITAATAMDGFGQINASTGYIASGSTGINNLYRGSQGYRTDDDTSAFGFINGDCGLTKVGARYYDVGTGSFISRDTDIGQAPFAYCAGDPINMSDPSGHGVSADAHYGAGTAWRIGGIGGAAVIALAILFAPEDIPVILMVIAVVILVLATVFMIQMAIKEFKAAGVSPFVAKARGIGIAIEKRLQQLENTIIHLKGYGPPSLTYHGSTPSDSGGTTTTSPAPTPPLKG